jgi:hypothetical protein
MKVISIQDIPDDDLNEWGYPDSSKWSFAGYTKKTTWWVKA